jgi:polyhydroxyalkanoate synthesis repressor PhaR
LEQAAPQTTKVIKRYANRKLYDTERSCYVTLEEISGMIKRGEEVKVIDNKSGEDLSAVTLAQIIFEEEKKKSKMPLSVLRNIIQSSSETISGFINEKVTPTLEKVSSEWDKSLNRVKGEGDSKEGDAPAAEEGEPRHVLQSFVKNSQRVFDDIQKKVDDRVRETVGAASHYATMGKDFEALKNRVESLEKKLQALLQR